jgi:hypothetical protein
MSDPVADLLLELYTTYKTTVFSNLFVGIVFGVLNPPSIQHQVISFLITPLPRRVCRPLWHIPLYPFVRSFLYLFLMGVCAEHTDERCFPSFSYRRNGRLLRSTPRLVMLTVTTVMFALGLIALVLQTTLSYQQFAQMFNSSSTSLWSAHRTNVVTAVVATIARIIVSDSFTFDIRRLSNLTPHKQYILSEVVCAWRAAVLWDYDRRVVAVLIVFLVGATCKSPMSPISRDYSA